MSTIKHVAARAGVSFTTVSHVVNGTRRVSDSARERVERAVAEMGYAPSAVARALKMSETGIIGVLVPNITNPFFAELTRGIEDCCGRTDHAVFLCNSDDDPLRQARYLQTLLERRVDRLLRAAAAGDTAALAQRLSDAHHRGRRPAYRRPGRRPGAGRPRSRRAARGRVHAVARAPRHRVPLGAVGVRGQPRAHGRLVHSEVTAIFASNDLLAIGALRAAAELGIAVPAALSVIGFDGFDGIDLGGYSYPALTTVGHPIRAMGEIAAGVLIDRIAAGPTACREVVLALQLLMRESTGAVPVR